MPLSALEVRNTKFSVTRVRAGYDMDEVDAFLDIVEADIAQFADELQRSRDAEAVLRTQCDQLQSRLNTAEDRLVDAQTALADLWGQEAHLSSGRHAGEVWQSSEAAEVMANDPDAREVLEMAQRRADEIVRQAEARAEAVRAAVRTLLTEQLTLLGRA